MNYRLTIKINDKNWSETEKSGIFQRALQIYLRKSRRKRKFDESYQAQIPNQPLVIKNSDSATNSSSESDDYESDSDY